MEILTQDEFKIGEKLIGNFENKIIKWKIKMKVFIKIIKRFWKFKTTIS